MAHHRQPGIALIAVLWVLLLLAFLAASFGAGTRTGANLARNLVENAKAAALADAGIQRAIAALARPTEVGGVRVDGTAYAWTFGGGEVRFAVRDEGGKIDLNAASVGLLGGLLRAAGLGEADSAALADAIADFRDPDDERRLRGAEDADYRSAGLSSEAKDAPFELVEELLQVRGMTTELYRRLQPAVTVHTGASRPDRSIAPPLVLAALSAARSDDPEGDDIDDMDGELDDPQRRDPGATDSGAPRPPGALTPLAEDGSDDRSGLGVYAVHAEGRSAGGAVFAREAVVRLREGEDPPYLVHAWTQGRRELFPPERGRGEGDRPAGWSP
ncbi:MAG: general secretion pathway protein GspK [Rhodospirillales bacterium]